MEHREPSTQWNASKAATTVPMIWREAADLIICKLPTQAWDAQISNDGARVLLMQLLEVVYGKRHAHEVLRMAEGVTSVASGVSSPADGASSENLASSSTELEEKPNSLEEI